MDFGLLLMYAAPVALAALGETVVQRSGVIHIGLEGTMLLAAFFGFLVDAGTHNPWLGLLAGMGVGALASGLFGLFAVVLALDQVVVGTAMNLFALGVTGTLFNARFGQSGRLLSEAKLGSWHGIDPIVVLTILLVPALTYGLWRTNLGLVIRATGEYPKATFAAGFSPVKVRLLATIFGGLLAGLGGAYLSCGIAGSFAPNMTAGRGFVAIAMVTFGRWRPMTVLLASLLIGFVESLQFRFQSLGLKIPFQVFIALPYLVALLVLAFVGRGGGGPAHLGKAANEGK